jgi:hypothetical protein
MNLSTVLYFQYTKSTFTRADMYIYFFFFQTETHLYCIYVDWQKKMFKTGLDEVFKILLMSCPPRPQLEKLVPIIPFPTIVVIGLCDSLY